MCAGWSGDERSVCRQRKWSLLSAFIPEAAQLFQVLVRGSDSRKLSGHATDKQLQVFLDTVLPPSVMPSATLSIRQILEMNERRNPSLASEGVRSWYVF